MGGAATSAAGSAEATQRQNYCSSLASAAKFSAARTTSDYFWPRKTAETVS